MITIRRIALAFLGLTLSACTTGVQIPNEKLQSIATDTLALGHPTAGEPTSVRLVGGSPGGCGSDARYVDVEIGYRGALSGKQYFMNMRYHVMSISPCEITADVRSDSGPFPPVLLDNAFASTGIGRMICEAM